MRYEPGNFNLKVSAGTHIIEIGFGGAYSILIGPKGIMLLTVQAPLLAACGLRNLHELHGWSGMLFLAAFSRLMVSGLHSLLLAILED